VGLEKALHVSDGVFAEMENARSKHGIRFTLNKDVGHVLEISRTATGDDRNGDSLADGAG
jgi:hypothetical protein